MAYVVRAGGLCFRFRELRQNVWYENPTRRPARCIQPCITPSFNPYIKIKAESFGSEKP